MAGNNPILHRTDGVALKDYVDARFVALERAVDKAESTLAARLAGMNEFREQLKDQAAKFVTRDEVGLMLNPICDDVRSLREYVSKQEGKASQTGLLFTAALALAGLILGAIGLFLK